MAEGPPSRLWMGVRWKQVHGLSDYARPTFDKDRQKHLKEWQVEANCHKKRSPLEERLEVFYETLPLKVEISPWWTSRTSKKWLFYDESRIKLNKTNRFMTKWFTNTSRFEECSFSPVWLYDGNFIELNLWFNDFTKTTDRASHCSSSRCANS